MNTPMLRADVINAVAAAIQAESYLEIGIHDPAVNFDRVRVAMRVGVDPAVAWSDSPWRSLRAVRSDDYFAGSTPLFDLAFIDGDHSYEQASRDVANVRERLTARGVIVMHDCNPPDEAATNVWVCGGVYRAFLDIRRAGIGRAFCVDTDFGVGVFAPRGRPPRSPVPIPETFGYEEFAAHRREWLGLVCPGCFEEMLPAWLAGQG